MNQPQELETTFIAESVVIEGSIRLGSPQKIPSVVRIHGKVNGQITEAAHTILQLTESSSVEGTISASEIVVAGFVQGSIIASKKILVQSTARIIGDIKAPKVEVQPGSYVEGKIISGA